jgi:hypothetical protein
LQLLLGADAIARVTHDNGLAKGYTEICCDELFPVVLRYCTKSKMLRMKIEYVTRIERVDESTRENFIGFYKPAVQARKEALRGVELEKRNLKRKADDDFIDDANIVRPKVEDVD